MNRLLIILSLVLMAISCSLPLVAEQSKKKFVVGLILPLSGELADYGVALKNGFEMAQAEAPERFRHIELRYQDSQFDQKTALNAFNALEQQGGVQLYHTWGVSPNETILPAANARGRPVLAETSMMSAAVGRPFVVRASRTGYNVAVLLIDAFVKKGWKKVGVVVTQIPYYTDIVDALKSVGAEKGVVVDLLAEVGTSEQDFRPILLKAKDKKLDAVGPLLFLNQLLTYCEQSRNLRIYFPMFGGHIHNSLDAMKSCMPVSDGVLLPGQVVAKKFRDDYVNRYHTDMRLDSAAHSYETARIIGELFGNKEAAHYDAQQILNLLKTVRREASSVGEYHYTDTATGGKAITFNEIALTYKNGKIEPLMQ